MRLKKAQCTTRESLARMGPRDWTSATRGLLRGETADQVQIDRDRVRRVLLFRRDVDDLTLVLVEVAGHVFHGFEDLACRVDPVLAGLGRP